MGDWIARLVQGNVAEVKVVLISVASALAAHQVVLAAIVTAKLGARSPSAERDDDGGGGVEQRDDSGSGRSGGGDDDDDR